MNSLKQQAFDFIDSQKESMIALWRDLIMIESDSRNKAGIDQVAAKLQAILTADGAEAFCVEYEKAGNMLIGTYNVSSQAQPIVFLGHMDTVFPAGTIRERPFKIADGKAYGPGVLDMKGGIVVLLYAMKALKAAGYTKRPLKMILAGDEENAHAYSDAAERIQQEAAGAIAAFNGETGSIQDKIVVGRTGGAIFQLEVHGVAAHAGNAPKNGRSAILEMAHKIIAIQALTNEAEQVRYNVGTMQGGTVSNTIPDYAKIEIDVRCARAEIMKQVPAKLQDIANQIHVDGTSSSVSGRIAFMPMETNDAILELFQVVRQVSEENGITLPEAVQSGGGSDSSNSVLAGVPTVCAMGVKGEKNHTADEFAVVDSLFERAKLVAACVLKLDHLG